MISDELVAVSESTARELLVDLVSIPSPSGDESTCATRLVDFFETHDREVWIDSIGNVHSPGDDGVLLTSHLDTVPGQRPVKVEDGTLWGRGSVDAKGPLAAMAVASVTTGASFVGVVREETDSAGAHQLIQHRDPPAALINGEPSGWDGITLGYRGAVHGTYHTSTTAGHNTEPMPNAIETALSWYQAVSPTGSEDNDNQFEQVSVTPLSFDGGLSDAGTAMAATIEFECRLPPGVEPASLMADLDANATDASITWGQPIPPVMMDARNSVATALRGSIREIGGSPRMLRKTGTSDMNVYTTGWDIPMATYGPGDSALDHAPDERLPLDAFDRSITVLESTATRLLSGDSQ